jgi:ABC-2 type transport system permease protein
MAGTTLHLLATTCMGIFLATVAGSMPQFGIVLIRVVMPLQVLSGATTSRESMPQIILDIMLAAPDTHFVILAQPILFRGAGLDAVWPRFAALLVSVRCSSISPFAASGSSCDSEPGSGA